MMVLQTCQQKAKWQPTCLKSKFHDPSSVVGFECRPLSSTSCQSTANPVVICYISPILTCILYLRIDCRCQEIVMSTDMVDALIFLHRNPSLFNEENTHTSSFSV